MGAFDISLKHIVTEYPHDWAAFFNVPPGTPVKFVDADLSTVQALADKVMSIGGPEPFLLHLEPQAQYDPDLDMRIMGYATVLHRRHRLPVQSTVLLLERRAAGPLVKGELAMTSPSGDCALTFRYRIIRVWELPTPLLLQEGLGILPLAPLGSGTVEELPSVLEQIAERFTAEAEPGEAAELWTATTLLLGLKYERTVLHTILQNVRHSMHISSTYEMILEEGEIRALRQTLLRLGTLRFGPPPVAIETRVNQEVSIPVLKNLLDQVVKVENWEWLR